VEPPSARRRGVLHFVCFGKRRKKHLCFFDLGKFWRRREAFERGCKHGMGLGDTTCRLIELRQRQRRAQFEAPRLLLLRYGDGGEECFLDWCCVRQIALEQYLTADAMGFGFEPTVPSPLGLCEGAIHSCVRRFKLPFLRLNLGQHGL
jgi:hypothetical protein